MKAAIFQSPGQPLGIEKVSDLSPGRGEVLIKVEASGICGSDLHATLPGAFLVPRGTILGHEFAGTVAEVGADVADAYRTGDRVAALPVNTCLECYGDCKRGTLALCPALRITGYALPGAYAEYVLAQERQVKRLPDEVSFAQGALVEPLTVGFHAVMMGKVQPGDDVLVVGAGPIGIAALQFAQLSGAHRVVISEMNASRRALAMKCGASAAIDPSAEALGEGFAEVAGRAPSVIFECVGVPGMLQHVIDLAPPKGRIVVVGVCMQNDTILPLSALMKELSIQFSLGYDAKEFELVIDYLHRNKIVADPMITNRVGFEELPAVFEALRTPSDQCKVMLCPA